MADDAGPPVRFAIVHESARTRVTRLSRAAVPGVGTVAGACGPTILRASPGRAHPPRGVYLLSPGLRPASGS